MIKTVDLSELLKQTDWPTFLSQEQRHRLLQEKMDRVEIYQKLNRDRDTQSRRVSCLEQK